MLAEGTGKDLLVIKSNAYILNSNALLAVATGVLLAVAVYCCTAGNRNILLYCCDVDSRNSEIFYSYLRSVKLQLRL